jgi:hypothetical protein
LTALVIDDVDTPALLALISTTTKSPALRELLLHSHEAFTGLPSRSGPAASPA